MVIFLERFDEQIIYGKPNRAAPVGIATKNAGGGFRGFVIDTADRAIDIDFVRILEVVARKSANSIGRQKLRFVEHTRKDALDLRAFREGEQSPHAARG